MTTLLNLLKFMYTRLDDLPTNIEQVPEERVRHFQHPSGHEWHQTDDQDRSYSDRNSCIFVMTESLIIWQELI